MGVFEGCNRLSAHSAQIKKVRSYSKLHNVSHAEHDVRRLSRAGLPLDTADTAYFSELANEKAKEPKELFGIEGATHIDLYDKEQFRDEVEKSNNKN